MSTAPAVTLYVAEQSVRGYRVVGVGTTAAQATQVLWRQLRASEHGRAVLALYGTKAEWVDEVTVHEHVAGQGAWL